MASITVIPSDLINNNGTLLVVQFVEALRCKP
jgi:hypothetical protein